MESWSLPQPSARQVVLDDGDHLLLAGGLTASGSVADVVLIDPAKGHAARIAQLAQPVHDAAGANLGSDHLVIGGGTSTSTATVQSYRGGPTAPATGRLPRPRSDLVAAAIGSTVYVVGGYDGARLDPAVLATNDGRHFRRVATLPVPVRYPAMAVAGGALYVFGGQTAGGPTRAVQRIRPSGAAAVVGTLPQPLAHAAAVTLGNRVFVLGGIVSGVASARIESFDPTTGRMSSAGRLPYPVADAGTAVLGRTAYLLGGENNDLLSTVIAEQLR